MEKAGPWLMRAMRVAIRVGNNRDVGPYMEFRYDCGDGPWEGLPQSIKDARNGPHSWDGFLGSDEYRRYDGPNRSTHNNKLHLWKIYSQGADDIEQGMYAAFCWLIKARQQYLLSELLSTTHVQREIHATFDALSWRDFKRYADPAFYENSKEHKYDGHRGDDHWCDLRDKLQKAAQSGNDPDAVHELARHEETRPVQPPFE